MMWLQNPSHTSGDSLKDVRREISQLSGTNMGISERKLTILKQTVRQKIIKLSRHINEFQMGYQPRFDVVNDKNGDLVERLKINC
jgi:hypothetical protein